MMDPEAFAGFAVVDGAIGVGAEPKVLPVVLRPLWVREMLTSASVTNPLMSRRLLATFLQIGPRPAEIHKRVAAPCGFARVNPRIGALAADADCACARREEHRGRELQRRSDAYGGSMGGQGYNHATGARPRAG